MKVKSIKFDETQFPPVLHLSIHGAPHRRQDNEVLQEYRDTLYYECFSAGIPVPFDDVLDINILFVDPTTPDLDNLLTAFYRAVDGKALKGHAILTDDGLIQKATIRKFYPNGPTKYENRVP